jgi:hypothetical protein
MKLLIYGGCHASAIKFILDKYSLCDVVVDTLVNYRLISTREPFPFDRLLQYDFVLFNPILNRAEYNTTLVEDHCRAKGIRFFKYPSAALQASLATGRALVLSLPSVSLPSAAPLP